MAEPSSVLFEAQDGYAVVTLNRPDRLNSFNAAMHGDVREVPCGRGGRDGCSTSGRCC